MTVKDLIGLLSRYPDDIEVAIEQPAHDYWKTLIASPIRRADMEPVVYSDYHRALVIGHVSDSEIERLVLK